MGKGKNYHNIFLFISAPWISEMKPLEEFNNDLLVNGITVRGGRYFDDIFIYLYVYWNIFKEKIEIREYEHLGNPYEVSLKILQRSEYIYSYHGEINVGDTTFNNMEKYYSFELPSLEFDFLNFVDEQTNEIPNQVKTNELWTAFQYAKI